jgi:hypothetical protein
LCQHCGLSVLASIGKTEKSKVDGGRYRCAIPAPATVMLFFFFLVKNSLVKRKCKTVCCRDATASCFVAKVRDEVFSHFHAVAVKLQRACSWLCPSPDSPFSASVSLGFPCTAQALFPEHLSSHCQDLRRTFSEICT